jgi:hypothetical protein
VVLPASGCEMIAKVRRRAISSVRVLINRLQLLPGYGPSLASGPAAPALAMDMMGPRLFANAYRAAGLPGNRESQSQIASTIARCCTCNPPRAGICDRRSRGI